MPSTSNVLDEARTWSRDGSRSSTRSASASSARWELGGKVTRRRPAPSSRTRLVPKAAKTRQDDRARRRRKRRGGTRADQAVNLIAKQPGHQRLGHRQDDENQAELPVPRPRRPGEREKGEKGRPQYYPRRLSRSGAEAGLFGCGD